MRMFLFLFMGLVLMGMAQKAVSPPKEDKKEIVIETTEICDPEEKTELPETFY